MEMQAGLRLWWHLPSCVDRILVLLDSEQNCKMGRKSRGRGGGSRSRSGRGTRSGVSIGNRGFRAGQVRHAIPINNFGSLAPDVFSGLVRLIGQVRSGVGQSCKRDLCRVLGGCLSNTPAVLCIQC